MTAAARLARLLSLALALTGGAGAWPARATGTEPDVARIAVDAAPEIRVSPARGHARGGAHCEPDLSGHWTLYQRIVARRHTRAMKEKPAAQAD